MGKLEEISSGGKFLALLYNRFSRAGETLVLI